MAMFGGMGGLTRLPNGLLAGPGLPQAGDMSNGAGSLTPLSGGMVTGPSFAGMSGAAPGGATLDSNPFPMPSPTAAPAHTGPSTWQTIAGLVGDGLLTATGHNAVFAPIASQARQNQAMMQRQAQQQAVEFQRQIQLEAWKQAHPDPTEFEKTMQAGGYTPGTPEYAALARQKAQNDAAGTPFVYEQYNPTTGGTDKVIAPRTSIPGMAPSASGGGSGMAVGTIVAGHKYLGGPTSDPRSWQEVGGAAPAMGPGGFPLYRRGY